MSAEHYIDNHDSLVWPILNTMAYFDVFRHPLTLQEIREFNRIAGCTPVGVEKTMQFLLDKGWVNESRGYYFLGSDESVVDRRLEANLRAQGRMRNARFFSSLIARFPFVQAVMISGSLSKGVMKPEDDIDFFIVTAPGRLWIARVLLTIFKKTVLLNSHRNFCLNYFVDSAHLEIPGQNIFTATEIGLILPMYNPALYYEFLKKNSWYRSYYPNIQAVTTIKEIPARYLGRMAEWLLSGDRGNRLDDWCLHLTRRYLARKYRQMEPERFQSDLETSKGVSRHHPHRQQFRVLEKYQQTIDTLETMVFVKETNMGLLAGYGESA